MNLAIVCLGASGALIVSIAAAAEPEFHANSTNISFAGGLDAVDGFEVADTGVAFAHPQHAVPQPAPSRQTTGNVARLAAHAKAYPSSPRGSRVATTTSAYSYRPPPRSQPVALTSTSSPSFSMDRGPFYSSSCNSCGRCDQCGYWARTFGRRTRVRYSLYDWMAEHPVLGYTAVTAAIVVPIVVVAEQ